MDIISFAFLPSSEPEFTSSRRRSPVLRCRKEGKDFRIFLPDDGFGGGLGGVRMREGRCERREAR